MAASAAVTGLTALFVVITSVTLTQAGTYMIQAKTRIDYAAATFAAQRTVFLDLFDSQAAAELALTSLLTPVQATLSANPMTFTAGNLITQPIFYTTTVTNEIIQMRARISTAGEGVTNNADSWLVALRVA